MQRNSIISGAREIQAAIEATNIHKHIAPAPTERVKANFAETLAALNQYSLAASRYSEAAKGVAKVFDIDRLENTHIWESLLNGENAMRNQIARSLSTIKSELPRIIELIQQHSVLEADTPEEIKSSDEVSAMKLSFIEDDGQFSTVQRVIQGLSACEELYRAIQTIYSNSTTPLAIGAIDSGSDKSFELFGSADAIKELRLLIVEIWDRVVFHKENKLGKRLELLEKSLPIIEKIKSLEQEGKLGKEESRIAINHITDGTKMFIAAGVFTTDIAKAQKVEPRLLLAPEPKLLAAPRINQENIDRESEITSTIDFSENPTSQGGDNQTDEEWESLPPEERNALVKQMLQNRNNTQK